MRLNGRKIEGYLMKNVLKVIGACLLIALFAVLTVIGYLTVDEFKPEDVEDIEIMGSAGDRIEVGRENTLMSWNIGYGALGDNADFFMDGGKKVYTADRARVQENLSSIAAEIGKVNPDILVMQEVDRNSSRSYLNDELRIIADEAGASVTSHQSAFAPNFVVSFVPVPVPPIGKVNAGLVAMSSYEISSAKRYSLPCPFSWPLRTFNLKRCLQILRTPVSGSDKEMVLINLHLEAYDEGDGKIAQTNMLRDIMQAEVDAGNYVIVAGDFNQTFSTTDISAYPIIEGLWQAGVIETADFGSEFSFHTDNSVPTCRSLDRALTTTEDTSPQSFQYYVIDGCIVSTNVQINDIKTIDLGFKSSDHNPVVIKFTLIGE